MNADFLQQGRVEIRGTFEYRDAEGNLVGQTPFVWLPPAEILSEQEQEDDDLGK